jgi:hypothetical protein
VTDAWRSVKIEQFEYLMAGSSLAMLRVSATPARRRVRAEERPTLVADDGLSVQRFAAIPSPPDERGVLRAAYSVPGVLITSHTRFSLQMADGSEVALPEPSPSARTGQSVAERVLDRTDAQRMVAAHETARAEAERMVSEHQAARVIAEEAAERARAELLALSQRVVDMERGQAESQTQTSASTLDELETWRGELERRLTATTSELGATKTRLHENDDEIRQLRGDLAEAGARAELAQAQIEVLERQLADELRSDPAQPPASEPVVHEAPNTENGQGAGNGAATGPRSAPRSAWDTAEIEALCARAEAEALELAARELAEATDEARSRL